MYGFFFVLEGEKNLDNLSTRGLEKKSKKTKSGTTPVREGWGSQKKKENQISSTQKQKKNDTHQPISKRKKKLQFIFGMCSFSFNRTIVTRR